MKADPFAQLKLLDVQALDSELDTLRHQLGSMAEADELAVVDRKMREVADQCRDLTIQIADLAEEQRKADRDVEQVKARRVRDQGLIDSGGVSNPKDLERMLHELQSLERRISDLEDVEIEVMERLETAQKTLAERGAQVDEFSAKAKELHAEIQRRAGLIGARRGEVETERGLTAQGIPVDLLGLYERLRTSKGGIGAAMLRARQCGGCMLTLDSAEIARIAKTPTDEVIRCEECDRILVRTGESGL